MMFEFQAYMEIFIFEAQKTVADLHKFNFLGKTGARQAGTIADMTHQLRGILHTVREIAYDSYENVGNDNGVFKIRLPAAVYKAINASLRL